MPGASNPRSLLRADLARRIRVHAARLSLQRAGRTGRFAQLVGPVEMVRDAGVTRRAVDELAGLDVLMVIRQIVELERAARGEQGAQEDDSLSEACGDGSAGASPSSVQVRRTWC